MVVRRSKKMIESCVGIGGALSVEWDRHRETQLHDAGLYRDDLAAIAESNRRSIRPAR